MQALAGKVALGVVVAGRRAPEGEQTVALISHRWRLGIGRETAILVAKEGAGRRS